MVRLPRGGCFQHHGVSLGLHEETEDDATTNMSDTFKKLRSVVR